MNELNYLNQSELFNQQSDGFAISNLLLRACIGHSIQPNTNDFLNYSHGFQDEKNSAGYVVLCGLLADALGIHRQAGYEDRILRAPSLSTRQELNHWHDFIQQNWNDAVQDLSRLYHHVQCKLTEKFKNNDLFLKRKITSKKYIQSIKAQYDLAVGQGKETVCIDMDLLNSYLSLSDTGYGSRCFIQHQVALSDVLYCHSLILPHRSGKQAIYPEDTEEGEWVIINRSSNGLVQLPVHAVHFA